MSNQTASASPRRAFLGVDTGSISTKGVIIDENRSIIARTYLGPKATPPRPHAA